MYHSNRQLLEPSGQSTRFTIGMPGFESQSWHCQMCLVAVT